MPPGAFGKPNACLAGARQVTTDWILFVDADTWFEVPFVDAIVRYAQKRVCNVLRRFWIEARHVLRTHSSPYAFALYFAGVSARSVNHPKSKEALANGQCMLFRRDAYERIGGHGAVLDSVIEDVVMARIAKLQRLKMRRGLCGDVGSCAHVRQFALHLARFSEKFIPFPAGESLDRLAGDCSLHSADVLAAGVDLRVYDGIARKGCHRGRIAGCRPRCVCCPGIHGPRATRFGLRRSRLWPFICFN